MTGTGDTIISSGAAVTVVVDNTLIGEGYEFSWAVYNYAAVGGVWAFGEDWGADEFMIELSDWSVFSWASDVGFEGACSIFYLFNRASWAFEDGSGFVVWKLLYLLFSTV